MVRNFLKDCLKITDRELLRELDSISTVEIFSKDEKLISVGEKQDEIMLLMDGIFRGYLIDPEGRDFTDCFGFQPGTPAMGCTRLDLPAQLNIQALNRVTVLKIPVEDVMELMKKYPEVAEIYNRYLTWSLEEHFERDIVKSTLSAGEKYRWFLEKYPDLLEKVSHKHIASFLNMVPQTLSRERKRLRKDGEKNGGANNATKMS